MSEAVGCQLESIKLESSQRLALTGHRLQSIVANVNVVPRILKLWELDITCYRSCLLSRHSSDRIKL